MSLKQKQQGGSWAQAPGAEVGVFGVDLEWCALEWEGLPEPTPTARSGHPPAGLEAETRTYEALHEALG